MKPTVYVIPLGIYRRSVSDYRRLLIIKQQKAPTEHILLEYCFLLLEESSYGAFFIVIREIISSRTFSPRWRLVLSYG